MEENPQGAAGHQFEVINHDGTQTSYGPRAAFDVQKRPIELEAIAVYQSSLPPDFGMISLTIC
jgi:hypothetical protein